MSVKFAQGTIFNDLRIFLKKRIKNAWLKERIKKLLRVLVNIFSRLKGARFPPKYDWDWRLEMLLEKYEPETTALVKKIVKPGMVIIDIGAHIGYYTRIFSRLTGKNGRVYAFEPDSENFELLKTNTFGLKNVKLIKSALSDEPGLVKFYRSQNTGCHSIIQKDFHKESILIETEILDDFAKKNNISKIDLIKLDVEGGEPMVLAGGKEILKSISMLVMEFTPENFFKNGVSPVSFFQRLENSFGFLIYAIKNNGRVEKIAASIESLNVLTADKESVNIFLKK
jgi:FkbM family methyltransferase